MADRQLPSRAVTFLFTDIEGSTRLWELYPDAMSVALADHNRLLREVVGKHSGCVFKTVGDGFCCAFTDSIEALAAAIEAERRLHVHTWPKETGEICVRMGIHTGSAIQHDGDYFGPTINRVARLMSIAHGSQILVSSSTAATLASTQLHDIRLRDLGSHRLKDLKQAETTYQVVADGLRADFPALASLDAHPNNLPSQVSSFIGRTHELAVLRERLDEHRVVTITGPGGIGKTRLALQMAAEVVQNFSGGVFFVALASIINGDLVAHALASALGIVELPNEPLLATVIRYIDGKQILLIFDNSERLLTESATLVKRIVSECPNARCLVTSREPLHLVGEYVERLSTMTTPEGARTVADLESGDGSRLFLERARAAVDTRLSLSANDCALIADICRRVDGIPLAIELAASRLATMPLARLADKLSSRLLVNKDPTADRRHRTLRDAIEWSYSQLDAEEKRLFMALSIFHGGCTIEALEGVTEAGADDAIESLVDKSLVQVDLDDKGNTRYRLLGPIYEFASHELTDAGSSERLRSHHFRFYGGLASSAVVGSGETKKARFDELDREMHNMRAALEWASENAVEDAAQLAMDLAAFWRARGSFTEGRRWFARLLAISAGLAPRLRASLLRQAGAFAAMQDDYTQSTELAHAALDIYRDIGDEAGTGSALHTIAEVAHRQGRLDEAERLYRDTYGHLDAAGHLLGKTICLMNEGLLARQMGQLPSAEALLGEASANAQLLDDRSVWAQILIERAWVRLIEGDAASAERSFREAFDVKEVERDLHGACQARLGIATAALVSARTELALREYDTALKEAHTLGAQIFVIDAIYGIGAVHALNGDVVAAAKCCGLATRISEKTKCEPRTGLAYEIASEHIRASLSEQQRAAATSVGATMRPEDAVAAGRATTDLSS